MFILFPQIAEAWAWQGLPTGGSSLGLKFFCWWFWVGNMWMSVRNLRFYLERFWDFMENHEDFTGGIEWEFHQQKYGDLLDIYIFFFHTSKMDSLIPRLFIGTLLLTDTHLSNCWTWRGYDGFGWSYWWIQRFWDDELRVVIEWVEPRTTGGRYKFRFIYPLVMTNSLLLRIAIYCGFTHWTRWFSIVFCWRLPEGWYLMCLFSQ